jgi:hypothetical protein
MICKMFSTGFSSGARESKEIGVMLRGDVELGGGVLSGAVEQQNGVGAVGDMARDFLEMSRESAAPTPRAGQMAPKREALSSADRRVGEAAFVDSE